MVNFCIESAVEKSPDILIFEFREEMIPQKRMLETKSEKDPIQLSFKLKGQEEGLKWELEVVIGDENREEENE